MYIYIYIYILYICTSYTTLESGINVYHGNGIYIYIYIYIALSVNLRTIWSMKGWPLHIAPTHSRVGEGARLLRRKLIDWLWTACERNAAERR